MVGLAIKVFLYLFNKMILLKMILKKLVLNYLRK